MHREGKVTMIIKNKVIISTTGEWFAEEDLNALD